MSTPAQTKRTPAPCTQTELLETADAPLTIAQHDAVSNVEQSNLDKEINDQLERCRKIAMITKKTCNSIGDVGTGRLRNSWCGPLSGLDLTKDSAPRRKMLTE